MNIKTLIKKYYKMYDGEYIDDFHKEIFIENSNIQLILKYRVLKHIVEQLQK